MRKKTPSPAGRLRKLERERSRLLDQLLRPEPLLPGSLSLVQRTCGKPRCHCADKPAHPVWVLITRRAGKPRCQVVRKADVEEVRKRVELYRRFRATLRRLRTIEKDERALLTGVMDRRATEYT
jgi:hypothetical protein